jgi:hypothetical protein
MSRRTALTVTLSALLLAACGDSERALSPSSRETDRAPVDSRSPEPTATATEPSGVAFEADTQREEVPSTGGPLGVTEIRVAEQDGYDRVVFELSGREPGEPGWTVEYVDEARQDGSGDPVDVDGEAVLSVRISGVGYPMDTGVDARPDDPAVPDALPVVEDVVVGSVFEGVFEAFVGTSGKVPFRVFRLADPARVVVDLRHE